MKMINRILSALLALVLVLGCAAAEERVPGNLPERGLIFSLTTADTSELFLGASYAMVNTDPIPELPVARISFSDAEGTEKAMAAFTAEDMQNPDKIWEMLDVLFDNNHILYTILLIKNDFFADKPDVEKASMELVGVDSVDMLGENDGYVYVGISEYDDVLAKMETDTQKAAAEKAYARCKELVANLTFQPIVFAEGEFTEILEGAMIFSTMDLNGNTVTQDLFKGKKLTVLNVWGTTCGPCVGEMPELAEWSQNMPEGVQLVGLVSDLRSYNDTEILETAQYICEATGADAYTNLVANADFTELLEGIVGVPTTFFVDGNGMIVGYPIVGANVEGCKNFVEEYVAK